MKAILSTTITTLLLIALYGFKSPSDDTNACLVKVDSKWGDVCEKCVEYKDNKRVYEDTYKVYLKNTCSDRIEVKLAFKEADGSWSCFPPRVVAPNDTIIGYACKSEKGQYLKWTRKEGDTEIKFPSDEEINEKFE